MKLQELERHFTRIGARAKIHPPQFRGRQILSDLSIDIGRDPEGEFFDVSVVPSRLAETQVIDVQPSLRHLLLLSRQDDGKHKFLCGHDERHWFVAAVPERAAVSTVKTAFDALKPSVVHAMETRLGVKPAQRNRRRNSAFIRQGEWFFLPVHKSELINEQVILQREPISRGRGKPHICDELVRQGGQLVYVSRQYPEGMPEARWKRLVQSNPALRHAGWTVQRANPSVFVRGKVRHSDHKTIVLDGWHRVVMNTEHESVAMRNVAFLD